MSRGWRNGRRDGDGRYTRASRDVPCPLQPSLAPWLSLQTFAGASWSPPPADAARARARPSSVSDRPRNRMPSRVPAAESKDVARSAGITSVPAVVAQHAGASDSPVQHPPRSAPGALASARRAPRGSVCTRSTERLSFRFLAVDFFWLWRFFIRFGFRKKGREEFASDRATDAKDAERKNPRGARRRPRGRRETPSMHRRDRHHNFRAMYE